MIIDIPDAAVEWLRTGHRGISSEAIWSRMTGLPLSGGRWSGMSTPHDPADLRRCRLLIESVPEFAARLPEMADEPGWDGLVARWGELCATMDVEAPGWRDGVGAAPKTWALMEQIREAA